MTDKGDKRCASYHTLMKVDMELNKKKVIAPKNSAKEGSGSYNQSDKRKRSRSHSRSPRREDRSKNSVKVNRKGKKAEVNYDLPDRSFGDLYCQPCDSHMNSEQMWEAHIQGKRHLKNTKKGEPVTDPKYEYLNVEPIAQPEIDDETGIIIGLQHICETQRFDQRPIYNCHICSASIPNAQMLIEHLLGLKHKMAYLKEHDHAQYALLGASDLKKSHLEPVVDELILKLESERGRGKMTVRREKQKPGAPSFKKSREDYDRYSPRRSDRSHERDGYSTSEWRRISPVKERPIRGRSVELIYPERSPLSNRSYADTERWHSSNTEPIHEPETNFYRRSTTQNALPHDSIWDQSHNTTSSWPTADDGKYDLREVLQQKKTQGQSVNSVRSINSVISPSVPIPSNIDNISDQILSLINSLSTEVFLSLTLFKLDNMVIEDMKEMKLLDRVVNRATSLSVDIKRKMLETTNLKAKFRETLAKNGMQSESSMEFPQNTTQGSFGTIQSDFEATQSGFGLPQSSIGTRQMNSEFTKNMENLIGHYKSRKTTSLDNCDPQISLPSYYNNRFTSESHPGSSQYSSNIKQDLPVSTGGDTGWNQQTSFPLQSFTSTWSTIPGLTLTDENPPPPVPPPQTSAFEKFAHTAKGILGNFTTSVTKNEKYGDSHYNDSGYHY